ncbi:amidohydrolase family protein [Blastococcus sp. PRF04-17]|uniref:amidohydrolase family protein n=1 Tax=Blastococcus sp. PRF04-17 TaxID=2933797 RepID=UPI002112AD96|nr:amidohydrolase family protein [Blastococcus sp. PRF04-17]
MRDAISAGEVPGPRIVAADAPITITGGHCWYMSDQCDTEAEVAASVRAHAEGGADVVKVMLTGGFLHPEGDTPHRPVYDEPVLRALVGQAHEGGMRVAVHAHGVDGIRRAVDAGVDTVEHCTMTTRGGVRYDAALARRIAEAGIVVVPTLNRRWLDDDLPWTTRDVALDVLRRLREDGVRLAVGTDCGIDGVGHADHLWGLRTLVASGMTPSQAFAAATETGAEACGLSGEVGRLEPGSSADLIAVRADPRYDLDALAEPAAVMTRGALVHEVRP